MFISKIFQVCGSCCDNNKYFLSVPFLQDTPSGIRLLEGSRLCVTACRANITRYNVAANGGSNELAASYAERQEIMATTDSTVMLMQMFKEMEQHRLADRREAKERMELQRREAEQQRREAEER